MAFSTKDFTAIVRDSVTAMQSKLSALVNFTIGSVLRSIIETNAALVMWLQGLVVQLLAMTRASTSEGADLDSWVADYGLTPPRLAATPATGLETFARFTTGQQAVVPIGANVQTADQSQKYTVVVDAGNPNYNASLGGYVIGPTVSSITVPVQSLSTGSSGNVLANTITSLATSIPYVDTVNNVSDFTNGADQESDADLRARFIGYISSLSKATLAAIDFVIKSVQQGVTDQIVENYRPDGTPQPGFFYAVVDDGSGSPSGGFLGTVAAAIDTVRPLCSTFTVIGPTLVSANVVFVLTTATSYVHGDVVAGGVAAVRAYIDMLTVGQGLRYTRLIQVLYDSSPGITNVSGLTLNGGTSDIAGTTQVAIRAGTVTGS